MAFDITNYQTIMSGTTDKFGYSIIYSPIVTEAMQEYIATNSSNRSTYNLPTSMMEGILYTFMDTAVTISKVRSSIYYYQSASCFVEPDLQKFQYLSKIAFKLKK